MGGEVRVRVIIRISFAHAFESESRVPLGVCCIELCIPQMFKGALESSAKGRKEEREPRGLVARSRVQAEARQVVRLEVREVAALEPLE